MSDDNPIAPDPGTAGAKGATSSSVMRESGKFSLYTLISRVTGLVRESVKAALLGTSYLSDAFSVAFAIPNFFRRLFAEGSITVAFIPTFKGYLVEGDEEKTKEFLRASLSVITFLVSCVVVLGMFLAPWIASAFGSNLDETTVLVRIMFPFLALVSVAAYFQGILNGIHIFTPTAVAPIVWNLVVIACSYLLGKLAGNPARAMAWGVIIGGVIQMLWQLPYVMKSGWAVGFASLRKAFKNPGVRQVLLLISPTIVGMAAYQINDMVCVALASGIPGAASSLQFSLRLQELILGVFAVSLSTVTLPRLSEQAKRGHWAEFNEQLRQSMDMMALITIPVAGVAILCSGDIVTLIFKWSSFTEESVRLTAGAFFFHSLGTYFIAMNRVIAPAFYANKDSKSPAIAGVVSMGLNAILAVVLSFLMKGNGIALALSVSSAVNTLILFGMLAKNPRVERGVIRDSVLYALRILCFTLIALVPSWFTHRVLSQIFEGQNRFVSAGLPFLGTALLFAVVGVLCLAVTRDRRLAALIRAFKRGK
jgi:putative peptidoglycan lipid II flippase